MGNRDKDRAAHRPRSKARGLFSKWIEATGLTYPQVAVLLGCSPQAVSNLRKGNTRPGRELANKIAKVSAGAVPSESWDTTRTGMAA